MLRPYDLLENILIDIEAGIREDINIAFLSKKYDLSERHLRRLFKCAFKQSLAEYLRSRRLVESPSDLVKTNAKLFDIALEFGFGYEQTYIRAFKREFGMTPGEFRKSRYTDKTNLLLHLFYKDKFLDGLFMVYFFERIFIL